MHSPHIVECSGNGIEQIEHLFPINGEILLQQILQ